MSGYRGDSEDDGITLKSSSQYPDEDITITNCAFSSHCNAIKIGTESMGGFKNVFISNIVVTPSSFNGELTPGQHLIVWNGTDSRGHAVSSGVYFYGFESDSGVHLVKKMTLMR